MPANPLPAHTTPVLEDTVGINLNWQYPVWLASMGLVLIGTLAFLRLLLPHHLLFDQILALLISAGIWRFGAQPLRTPVRQTLWIRGEAYSFFGFQQSVLNSLGFTVLLTSFLAWQAPDLPFLFVLGLSAVGGVIFGAFGFDLQARKAPSENKSASI